MQDLNCTIFHGHITRDAELKYTTSGTPVSNFGVAVNGYGEKQVSFYEVQIWNKYAETMSQYLTKGKEVVIKGKHEQQRWVAQDGTKRNKWVLNAETITMCGGKKDSAPAGNRASSAQRKADQSFEDNIGGEFEGDDSGFSFGDES